MDPRDFNLLFCLPIAWCGSCRKRRRVDGRGLCTACGHEVAAVIEAMQRRAQKAGGCRKVVSEGHRVQASLFSALCHAPAQHDRPLPLEPTTAMPGSLKKIEIMEQRYADGFHVHHPLDLRYVEQSGRFLIPDAELEEVA